MTPVVQEDELSLADLWVFYKQNKKVILLTPLVCGFAAFIWVKFIVTPQWETSAILKIGQVGQAAVPAEPIPNAVARILAPSFCLDVLKQTNLNPAELMTAKKIYQDSLKVTKIKDADLLELRIRGATPEISKTLLLATVSYLKEVHDKLMAANIENIKSEIKANSEAIEELKTQTDLQRKLMQREHSNNANNTIVAISLLHEDLTTLRELKKNNLFLIEQLDPSKTFSTRTMGDISVSENPVFPKKFLTVVIAILLGLFGGIFISFIQSAINKNKI